VTNKKTLARQALGEEEAAVGRRARPAAAAEPMQEPLVWKRRAERMTALPVPVMKAARPTQIAAARHLSALL